MMENINYEFLRKIHEGIDEKCHIAITKNWDPSNDFLIFPDKSYFYDQVFNEDEFYTHIDGILNREEDDAYFSINSYRGRKKKEEDVWHLNAFALDFDYYKITEYENYTAEQMYEVIKDKLPLPPTAVVDSGRGLYIIYTFQHCPRQMTGTYKSIYKTFCVLFEEYGMDARALNVTQIIRIPGTYNSKVQEEVRVLELHDTQYKIEEFYHLFPYTQEEVKVHKEKRAIKNRNRQKQMQLHFMENEEVFNHRQKKHALAIFDDFERLINLRNKAKIRDGYRETLIFLVRRYCRWYGASLEEEMKYARKYNDLFLIPLDERELVHNTKPAGNKRRPGIKWIIEKMSKQGGGGITPEEQKHLRILRSKRLKDASYQKRKRKMQLLNITPKQKEMLERRTRVIELKRDGRRNKYIADVLGLDKSRVTRDLQYIKAHAWQFKRELKEIMDELMSNLNTTIFTRFTRYEEQKQLSEWLKLSEIMLN